LAFLLAVVTWILFAFFNVTVVLWADTCVQLDKMELDVRNSKLLDQIYSDDTIKQAIDVCLNGKYIPDAFNVTNQFDFTELKQKLYNDLTVDVGAAYDVEVINDLENFYQTLGADDYEYNVNGAITLYNQRYLADGLTAEIDRNDLSNGRCTNPPRERAPTNPADFVCEGNAGVNIKLLGIPPGAKKLEAIAFYDKIFDLYEVEESGAMQNKFDTKVWKFRNDSFALIQQMDELKNYSINVIQKDLASIKCSLAPLWQEMDKLLFSDDTAFCNQVGQQYGEMKTLSCEKLFRNFEHTNRSLLIIAIFSTFIGFLSVALGRRIHKRFNIFEQKTHDFGNNRANTSMFFS